MTTWIRIPGMRVAEYCDVHGHRLLVEASRWGTATLGDHHVDEYQGFIGGIRVGTWHDFEEAKRETLTLAARRFGTC